MIQHQSENSNGVDTTIKVCVIALAVVALCGVLYFAKSLLVPIVISLLAFLTLRPIVARLRCSGIPNSIASGFVIGVFFLTVAVLAVFLYSPVQSWAIRAPQSLRHLNRNFAAVAEPIEAINEAEAIARETKRSLGMEQQKIQVEVEKPDLIDPQYLINTTGTVLALIVIVAAMTYFLLASGDDLLNRVLATMPNEQRQREMLKTIGRIQDSVGQYLTQISLINVALGVVVGLAMYGMGMPTPILWGAIACLFNFVPYVGPLVGATLVLLAAGSVFESTWWSLATASLFYGATGIEGQFVTPSILGRTLRVGPVVVIVAVAFWGFLWGIPGVILAVPMLIVTRTALAAFDQTLPIAMVLGEESRGSRRCEVVKDDRRIAEAAKV